MKLSTDALLSLLRRLPFDVIRAVHELLQAVCHQAQAGIEAVECKSLN